MAFSPVLSGYEGMSKLAAAKAKAALLSTASCAAVAVGLAWPSIGHAADADGAAVLEEVLVYAERREQRLQEVSISASVFSGDELIRKGVVNVHDIQQISPSLAINTYNRSTYINIRGVGIAQSAPTSSPGVAFYIDGTLIPHEFFIDASFYDIASVEVLRGPQGTLSGQNSTGGAVYVRTPDPAFSKYSAKGSFTAGNYGKFSGTVAANAGFSDNVALRLAATHDERDSFSTNVARDDIQPGDLNLDAVRASLAIRTSDDRLKINLRGEYFDSESDNNAVKNRLDPNPDPFVISEDARSIQNRDGYRLSGEVRYDINDSVQGRAVISWQDAETFDQTDGDRTSTALPRPPGSNTGRISNALTGMETLITEVNFLSIGESSLQWVVGGFYMDETIPVNLLRDNFHTVEYVSSSSTIQTEADNTSKSLFGQVNYRVSDQFEILAGARHSWDRQHYTRFQLPGPPIVPFADVQKSREWTGKLGVNYHMNEQTLVYLTASKGYKAGGVNLTANTPNFGPETNFVYELGVKTEFLDRRLRVNGNVFYSDYRDIQLSSLFNALPVTQNAAKGESYGAELEIAGRFDELGFNLGVGYLDATFKGDGICLTNTNAMTPTVPTPPAPAVPCPGGTETVPDGRALPFSPEWTINAGVEYNIAIGGEMTLTPRVQWSYIARQVATPFPSFQTVVPGRNVFDARLTLDVNENISIEGYMTNFTDKTYIAAQVQNSSSADGGIIYGAPRQYGIRFVAKMGE